MAWWFPRFAKMDSLSARLLSFLPERATDAKQNAIPFAGQARGASEEILTTNPTEASEGGKKRSEIRKAALLPFVFVMYAYATGGPFGLEEMVTTSGPGLTLLYHVFIPFFWCIPVSLVAAELTTAMPVEGGFYR